MNSIKNELNDSFQELEKIFFKFNNSTSNQKINNTNIKKQKRIIFKMAQIRDSLNEIHGEFIDLFRIIKKSDKNFEGDKEIDNEIKEYVNANNNMKQLMLLKILLSGNNALNEES